MNSNANLTNFSAKAIGLRLIGAPTDNGSRIIHPDDGGGFWNPLKSGDDAMRLAVSLGMNLSTDLRHRFVMCNDEQICYDESKFGGVCDPVGAMRRAIVQAAAEILRKMK